jgi:hypothetical protein
MNTLSKLQLLPKGNKKAPFRAISISEPFEEGWSSHDIEIVKASHYAVTGPRRSVWRN